jgi:hypothetical protein
LQRDQKWQLATVLSKEIVQGIQALSIEFAAEILTSPIMPFSDNGHPSYNFGEKLPSALPIILAEFRAEFNSTTPRSNEPSLISRLGEIWRP